MRVALIKEDAVVVDYNHPLVGKTLYFRVKVLNIQDPSGKQHTCNCGLPRPECLQARAIPHRPATRCDARKGLDEDPGTGDSHELSAPLSPFPLDCN